MWDESKSVKKFKHVKVTFNQSDLIDLETFNDYPGYSIFCIEANNTLQKLHKTI